VFRVTPKRWAVSMMFRPDYSQVATTWSITARSRVELVGGMDTGEGPLMCSAPMTTPLAAIARRARALRSSRTLPGQRRAASSVSAASVIAAAGSIVRKMEQYGLERY
jgi:hypothetical protein